LGDERLELGVKGSHADDADEKLVDVEGHDMAWLAMPKLSFMLNLKSDSNCMLDGVDGVVWYGAGTRWEDVCEVLEVESKESEAWRWECGRDKGRESWQELSSSRSGNVFLLWDDSFNERPKSTQRMMWG
jgi:hypothetical protein